MTVTQRKSQLAALIDIMTELADAERKHPDWPADPIHAAAILAEESGELIQASIDFYNSPLPAVVKDDGGESAQALWREIARSEERRDHMRKEAAQTGAMAIRFLMHLDSYETRESTRQASAPGDAATGGDARSVPAPITGGNDE
jgi:NTP pyrophosphatase (non-canonical NTP hydrolase)